jgi:ABC-type antimicrobial peptide transport system permease subunit
MSVMVSTVGRRPAVLTGFIGLILGAAFGIGLAWAIMSTSGQLGAGAIGRGTDVSNTQMGQALNEFGHVLREYGSASVAAPSSPSFAEGQRQAINESGRLLRAYGAASVAPANEFGHVLREYGPVSVAAPLNEFGHVLRQYGAASNGN